MHQICAALHTPSSAISLRNRKGRDFITPKIFLLNNFDIRQCLALTACSGNTPAMGMLDSNKKVKAMKTHIEIVNEVHIKRASWDNPRQKISMRQTTEGQWHVD
jgi:hypothetical protein